MFVHVAAMVLVWTSPAMLTIVEVVVMFVLQEPLLVVVAVV